MREAAVLAYLAAIVVAWIARSRSRRGGAPWLVCILLLALLAIEQQFGLFSGFTGLIRDMAISEHWYEERKAVQHEAVIGLGIIGLLLALVAAIWLRRASIPLRLTMLGTLGLLILALVKAISLHGLDALFARSLPGMPVNLGGGLELIGLAIVLAAGVAGALQRGRRRRV